MTVAAADSLCAARSRDGAPARSGDHHCVLCFRGAGEAAANAPMIASAIVIRPPPGAEPARGLVEARAPSPPGWASSWSSRAPPSAS